jgi:hypothetical protein
MVETGFNRLRIDQQRLFFRSMKLSVPYIRPFLNVMVERVAILSHMRKVPSLIVGTEVSYFDLGCLWFYQSQSRPPTESFHILIDSPFTAVPRNIRSGKLVRHLIPRLLIICAVSWPVSLYEAFS